MWTYIHPTFTGNCVFLPPPPRPSSLLAGYGVHLLPLSLARPLPLHSDNTIDGGDAFGKMTINWPGLETEVFLSYDQVVKRLAEVPEKIKSGEYIRDNSLGLLKLNPLLWEGEKRDSSILLASGPEVHNFYRPYLDRNVGKYIMTKKSTHA